MEFEIVVNKLQSDNPGNWIVDWKYKIAMVRFDGDVTIEVECPRNGPLMIIVELGGEARGFSKSETLDGFQHALEAAFVAALDKALTRREGFTKSFDSFVPWVKVTLSNALKTRRDNNRSKIKDLLATIEYRERENDFIGDALHQLMNA